MTKVSVMGRALLLDLFDLPDATVRPCTLPSAAGANTRGCDTCRVAAVVAARAVVVAAARIR